MDRWCETDSDFSMKIEVEYNHEILWVRAIGGLRTGKTKNYNTVK